MIQVTGSLQIKNKIYQAVLSYKQDGKWKEKWKSTRIRAKRGNKKKAESELERIKSEFQKEINNNYIETEEMPFIDYMKKWLKMIQLSIEETTYSGYEKLIYGRMTDYFQNKNITINNIKPQDIQDFYGYLINNGLSGNTVKHYHANIRKAMHHAVKTGMILYNPADNVELPRVTPYIAKHYTSKEIVKLLKLTKNTKLETPVILGCFYGLRRSEVVGLKWSAIDFNNKTITINHVVTQITQDHESKLIKKDRTKNKSSTRTLPLLPVVETYLLDLNKKQERNRIDYGKNYSKDFLEYVCVDDEGNLLSPDYISHAFSKLLKKNNMKVIRFHDLRHSVASILLAEGINMKQIQIWLGHSNYNTTANIYAHLDTNSMNGVASTISNALKRRKRKRRDM